MTGNETVKEPDGPHPYFLAIEDVFLELRGSPLQLSPKDWQTAREWYEKTIPLELVERVVREIFERRKAKGNEDKVWTLGHCKRAVQAAWRRQQELVAAGQESTEPSLDLEQRLQRLAESLPEGLAGRETFADQIRGLRGDAEAIESELATLDRTIVESLSRSLSPETGETIKRELATSRQALAGRLPAAELERSSNRLREEILRRELALPVLSLFAPEAAEASE